MRLFRRNALGIYAVYAAAMVSGLVVTPILLDSIGTEAFGIWAFIGGITIYLAVLDFGARAVGRPLHGRGAWAARPGGDQPRSPRSRSSSTRRSACSRSSPAPSSRGSSRVLIDDPGGPRLGRADLDVPRHALARSPLPARPLLQPARRPPPLRPAEPRQLRRDRALRGSRRAADPARRRPRPARGADDPRHGAAPGAAAGLAAARAAPAQPAARLRHACPDARPRRRQLEQLPRPRREQGRLLHRRRRRRDRARGRGGGALRDRRRGFSSSRSASASVVHVAALPGVRRVRGLGRARAAAPAAAVRACAGARRPRSCSRCRCS